MRLAIIGSQGFSENWKYVVAEGLVYSFIYNIGLPLECVISGGCPTGVDSMAEDIAKRLGFREDDESLVIHRPLNQQWAPFGYMARNMQIAFDCTHLLCIRDKQSKTYGSGWTADFAERIGRLVWRFEL